MDAVRRWFLLAGQPQDTELRIAQDGVRPLQAARRVLQVLEFCDGLAETLVESFSRVTMRALAVPPPVLQRVSIRPDGREARPDFFFDAADVIGEADGRVKYSDRSMTRGEPARVVCEEKQREDDLRAQVAAFGRWGFADSRSPRLLGEKLARTGVHPVRAHGRSSPRASM